MKDRSEDPAHHERPLLHLVPYMLLTAKCNLICSYIEIQLLNICFLLMYADDIVLLTVTPEGLSNYILKWDLTVNTDKTKMVSFQNRGNIRHNEEWFYNMRLKSWYINLL